VRLYKIFQARNLWNFVETSRCSCNFSKGTLRNYDGTALVQRQMSLHDYNVIKQGDKFCCLCPNLDAVPHLQLQPNFPTLKWLGVDWVTWSNRKKVWTEAKHIFSEVFNYVAVVSPHSRSSNFTQTNLRGFVRHTKNHLLNIHKIKFSLYFSEEHFRLPTKLTRLWQTLVCSSFTVTSQT